MLLVNYRKYVPDNSLNCPQVSERSDDKFYNTVEQYIVHYATDLPTEDVLMLDVLTPIQSGWFM